MSRKTEFSGVNRDRERLIFAFELTTSTMGNLTRCVHTPVYVVTIQDLYQSSKVKLSITGT